MTPAATGRDALDERQHPRADREPGQGQRQRADRRRRRPAEDAGPAGPGLHQQHRARRSRRSPRRSATCASPRTTPSTAQAGVAEWGGKALAASHKADELRAAGNTAEADRFDDLAKVALKRQIGFEDQAKTLATQIATQTELIDRLKDGLNGMRAKREELVQKRDELVARAKMADAQAKVQESLKSINATDPTSEVSRFEEKIRHEEAQVRGHGRKSPRARSTRSSTASTTSPPTRTSRRASPRSRAGAPRRAS